jgi:hypothetical protein
MERARSNCPRIYIVIDIIIAPESAPQTYVSPLGGVEHPLAPQVMQAMRQHGKNPVGLWKIVNSLANAKKPDSRARRRCWRLRYWGACRELRKAKLLFRHGSLIATSDFAIRPKPRSPVRRRPCPVNSGVHLLPSVGASTSKNGGSSPVVAGVRAPYNHQQPTDREFVSGDPNLVGCTPDTKSATPTAAEISAAASALAKRPRKVKRPWTGYLDGERIKRGTLVRVPSGEVLPVYIALRGRVLVTLPDEPRYADRVFDRYDADQVRRVKLPEARLLGSLKAGTKEVFSLRKQEAARANSRRPPEPTKMQKIRHA